jgi:diadenosine tetraphosphate (Ap4A) HIT family hydrolase
MTCELCESDGGTIIWRDERVRVVRVADPDYPDFCRVIWNDHVREMTDLAPTDRVHLLRVVLAVEGALRNLLNPAKINLASLGNMTPHLHWHVIPRFEDDRHFPRPVWAEPLRKNLNNVSRPQVSNEILSGEVARILGSALL